MLISCPKCHSIYEIPDNLIPKSGQNFRCQACHNIWHALPQDALGYEEEKELSPLVEEIIVDEPPYRNYPANKEHFEVPLDRKSGKKTISSSELIDKEGDKNFIPPQPKPKKELTLRSESGAFFTISLDKDLKEDNSPYFASYEETIKDNKPSPLPSKDKPKSYILLKLMLFILFILTICIFLRRDIVTFYPKAENYYNKIFLSGLNNPEYLVFENISINEEDNNKINLSVTIKNNSRYNTFVPDIIINNKTTHKTNNQLLKANETKLLTIPLDIKKHKETFILNFKRK